MASQETASTSGVRGGDAPELKVFGFARTYCTPCASPFVLKLQTYLRMTGINYKAISSTKVSSKGKLPFIEHKGKQVADSTFIIQYLNSEYDKNLNSHLSDVEKAISLAFQRLVEENLYMALVYQRWIVDGSIMNILPLDTFKKKMVFTAFSKLKLLPSTKANLKGHGMGRHSKEEIFGIAERDLSALSDFLGEKLFFMGDELSEVDASVFGFLAETIYGMPGSASGKFITEKLHNLVSYTTRMKEKFWPDWDQICLRRSPAANKTEQSPEPTNQAENQADMEKVQDNADVQDDTGYLQKDGDEKKENETSTQKQAEESEQTTSG